MKKRWAVLWRDALPRTGILLGILLAVNVVLSFFLAGKPWALVPLLAVAVLQAGLLAYYLMELGRAALVARIYMGVAVFLMGIACLTFADYLTRSSPLEGKAPENTGER